MASYWLTRFVFFRLLGLIYTVAFLIVVFQWPPLLGSDGLLPAASFLDAVGSAEGRGPGAFLRLPSVFWLHASDAAFRVGGYVGLGLSLLVLLGLANVPILFVLLAPLHVLRPRRPDLLRIRLGDAPAGDRLPGHLPRPPVESGALPEARARITHRDRPPALARLPADARRRPHQAAGGPLLARPHVSRLSLRDAAESEPALLVLSSGPGVVPRGRGALQSPGRARRPILRLRSAAGASGGGRVDRRVPGAPDPERQPVFPQLADDRGGRGLFRRRPLRAAAARVPACAPRPPRRRSRGDEGPSHRRLRPRVHRRLPEPQPADEHAVPRTGHEHVLRSLRSRQYVWRLRQHRPGALRDRAGGYRRRPGQRRGTLGRVRLQVQARLARTAALLDLALPPPPRLADVVPGHAGRTRGKVVRAPRREAPRRRPRRARSPRGRTVRGPAAARRARPVLPLRVYAARRAHARMVEAHARLRVPARARPGRPAPRRVSSPRGRPPRKSREPIYRVGGVRRRRVPPGPARFAAR